MEEKRILKKGEWISELDGSIHNAEDGCRYGQADGPDDFCKECDCGDDYREINENLIKEYSLRMYDLIDQNNNKRDTYIITALVMAVLMGIVIGIMIMYVYNNLG